MSDSATNQLIAKGIEAARIGNRQLARLHFERAAKGATVDPIVWLWLAWVADSPAQALTHLKKIQGGAYASLANAGQQWLKGLAEECEPPAALKPTDQAESPHVAQKGGSGSEPNGPVYSLGCPGCRARLRIWGKLIGPLHNCPACGTVFVAEQDPHDPKRLIRRRLSALPQSAESTISDPQDDLQKPAVLVVDDRHQRRLLMMNVLKRAGLRVIPATDAIEAVASATQQRPQVILVDGNLQSQDAQAICRDLRNREEIRSVPILVLSNKTGFFDQVQARLAGVTVYLTKPCDAEVLVSHVYKLIGSLTASPNTILPMPEPSQSRIAADVSEGTPFAVHSLAEFDDLDGAVDTEYAPVPASASSSTSDRGALQASIFG